MRCTCGNTIPLNLCKTMMHLYFHNVDTSYFHLLLIYRHESTKTLKKKAEIFIPLSDLLLL